MLKLMVVAKRNWRSLKQQQLAATISHRILRIESRVEILFKCFGTRMLSELFCKEP